jgi:hypothetical protein
LFPAAISYLESILKVQRSKKPVYLQISDCNKELVFNDEDKSNFYDTDVLLFVKAVEIVGTLA